MDGYEQIAGLVCELSSTRRLQGSLARLTLPA
jgi:hypothetical protein